MYFQFLKIDKDFGLIGGTAKKVYNRLLADNMIEEKKVVLPFSLSDDDIKDFRNVFSKKNTYKSGLMADSQHVSALLEWFMLVNPDHAWEDCITAAKDYVVHRLSSDSPQMIMKASTFIKKNYEDGSYSSRLLEYLEREDGEEIIELDKWL